MKSSATEMPATTSAPRVPCPNVGTVTPASTASMILSSAALPIARYSIIHKREELLSYELRQMRDAIDRYKDLADSNKIRVEVGRVNVQGRQAHARNRQRIALAQARGNAGSFDRDAANAAAVFQADQGPGLLDDAGEHGSILRDTRVT